MCESSVDPGAHANSARVDAGCVNHVGSERGESVATLIAQVRALVDVTKVVDAEVVGGGDAGDGSPSGFGVDASNRVPDDERGQVVKAYVALRSGFIPGGATVKDLQDFVKKTVAPYKYPRQIAFVTDLPKTATGKIQRFKLRDAEKQAG